MREIIIELENQIFYKFKVQNNKNIVDNTYDYKVVSNYNNDLNLRLCHNPVLKTKCLIMHNIKNFKFSFFEYFFNFLKIFSFILFLNNLLKINFDNKYNISGKTLNLNSWKECIKSDYINNKLKETICKNISAYLGYFNFKYKIGVHLRYIIIIVFIFLILKNIIYIIIKRQKIKYNNIFLILNFVISFLLYILELNFLNFFILIILNIVTFVLAYSSENRYKLESLFSSDYGFLILFHNYILLELTYIYNILYIIYCIYFFMIVNFTSLHFVFCIFNLFNIIKIDLQYIKIFSLHQLFNNCGNFWTFINFSLFFLINKNIKIMIILILIIIALYTLSLLFIIIFYTYGYINYNYYLKDDSELQIILNNKLDYCIKSYINFKKIGNDYFKPNDNILYNDKSNNKNEGFIINLREKKKINNNNFKITNINSNLNNDICYICCVNQSNIIILPCYHGGLCSNCYLNFWVSNNNCILCKKEIDIVLEYKEEESSFVVQNYFIKVN